MQSELGTLGKDSNALTAFRVGISLSLYSCYWRKYVNNILMARTSRDITPKDAFCTAVCICTVLFEPNPTCSYKVEDYWIETGQEPLLQVTQELGTEQ